MNELLVSRFLKNTFISFNDFNTKDFKDFKMRYFERHKKHLLKYGYFEKSALINGNRFFKYIYNIEPMYNNRVSFIHTRVKLGKKEIMIPVEMDIMMELIFSKDLNKRGLFRRSAAINKVKNAEKDLFNGIFSETARENIIRKLKDCDIITLTIVFKKLFDRYKLLFPIYFLPKIVDIIKTEDLNEKLIRTKLIILSLPTTNRFLLDSICKFFSCIHFISTDKGTDYTENMNIRGFAVVMAPKLFVKNNSDITMELLNDAITFLDFIFCNSQEIFSVDKDIL